MDHSIDIAPNLSSVANNGKLTFVGVTRRLFTELEKESGKVKLRRTWGKQTRINYARDYEARLIAYLDPAKPLEEYEAEDFDYVMEKLLSDNTYVESTTRHYRHLLWTICDAAEQLGICANVLWGTRYGLDGDEDTDTGQITRMLRTKKSLAVHEQLLILNKLLKTPEEMTGQDLGLLIMVMMGLRNNEACGLCYDDIEPMDEHPEINCIWVYKSTVKDRAILKGSGKTKNANRVLPFLELLNKVLMDQRTYLEKLVNSGKLILAEGMSVGDLPIVCKGTNYIQRCSASDLTKAGKCLLKECKVGERTLEVLDEILHSETFQIADVSDVLLKEKDPTTYLFRRNMVTMLSLLGLSPAQIQYYIGHVVEDPYETRNFFTNEEKLFELKELLERHPYELVYSCTSGERETMEKNGCQGEVKIPLAAGQEATIRVIVLEPMDELKVQMSSIGNVDVCITESFEEKQFRSGQFGKNLRYANVRGEMERVFLETAHRGENR